VSATIIGTGTVPCRRWYGEQTAHQLSLTAIRAALKDAALKPADVDGLYTTQVGWFAVQEKFLAQRMAETLGIRARAQMEVECGGASSLVALRAAVADVAAGRVENALVWAADVEIPTKRMDPEKHLPIVTQGRTWYGPYVSAYGVVAVVALYAMSAQAYMHRHGVSAEAVAALPVTLRKHAKNNPLAFLRDEITLDDVLSSRMVSPPLHFLECAPWADGAAAVVVSSDDEGVMVRAFGEAHDPTSFAPLTGDVARYESAARAAVDAYDAAGITAADIDVAEVYGAFAVTELQLYEELGFAEPGQAAEKVAAGRTTYGGDVVINPSGGRLSLGHPPYVTPLYEVIEVVEQLRGRAGDRQVKNPRWGLAHAEHGMVNGSVVAIFESPGRAS
jgi:benzoylsuccinyl-CoA thiolase BbsB subunit